MLQRNRAFTLLELIVVIVILALLAALAIPTFAKVTKTSKLKVAEVSAAALIRDAVALARFDGDVVTGPNVVTAANELPVRVSASGGLSAAGADGVLSEGAQVVFGAWEFSGNPRVISARLLDASGNLSTARTASDVAGTRVGVAIWVPDAGCAVGVSDDLSGATRTWHYLDDELGSSSSVAQANCNGALGFIGEPDSENPVLPAGIRAPRRPVIKVELDVTKKCVTIDFLQDPANFLDVYINGKYVETIAKSDALAGTTKVPLSKCLDRNVLEDEVVVVESPGPKGTSGGGAPRDGGVGGTGGSGTGGSGTGGSGTGTGGGSAPAGAPSSAASGGSSIGVTLPAGAGSGVTIWRSPAGGGTGTAVGTPGGYSGGNSYYETAPSGGSWWYWWTSPSSGSGWLSPVVVTKPRVIPSSGDGALYVTVLEGHARVSWGAVEDIPVAPLSGYRLYRGIAATESEARAIVTSRALADTRATPAKNETTYLDPEDLRTAWWCYALSAWGPGGDSGKSNTACVQVSPGTPGGTDSDDGVTPLPTLNIPVPSDSGTASGSAYATTCTSTNIGGRSNQTCKGTFPYDGTFGYTVYTDGSVSSASRSQVRFRLADERNYWVASAILGARFYNARGQCDRYLSMVATQYVNGAEAQTAAVGGYYVGCNANTFRDAFQVSSHGTTVVVNGRAFVDNASVATTATGLWLEASGASANTVDSPTSLYASESSVPTKAVVTLAGTTLRVARPVDADAAKFQVFVDGVHHSDTTLVKFAGAPGTPVATDLTSIPLTGLTKGTHAVKVFVVDQFGKVSPVASLSVTAP